MKSNDVGFGIAVIPCGKHCVFYEKSQDCGLCYISQYAKWVHDLGFYYVRRIYIYREREI